MRNLWKRVTAFALMLSMLFCVLPMMAFAEDTEPAQMDSITYNFGAIRDHEFTYYNANTQQDVTTTYSNVNMAENSIKGRALKAELERLYGAGESNWCYDSKSAEIGLPNFNIYATGKNSEMYLAARSADTTTYLKDVWFAIRIQSPGTGEYKMTLDTALVASGVAGSAYVLPATVTDIDGALTEAAYVGSFSCYSETTVKNSIVALDNTVSLKAGKDYLLVITVDSANEDGGSYLFMNSVTLDAVKNLDSITYDFYLSTDEGYTYGETTFGSANVNITGSATAKAALDGYYEAGTLHWKWLNDDLSNPTMNISHKKLYVYNSASGSYTTGNYFAVTVRSPGTGSYQMTLNYGQATNGSTNGGVYLFDASVDPAAWATATPLFKDSVSYSGTANVAAATTTVFDASIPMEAGKEYTLVFTNEGAATSGTIHAMYLDSMVLNKVAAPESLNTITYDLYLGDNADLTYTYNDNSNSYSGRNILEASNTAKAGYAQLQSYYTAGTLDWQPLSDDFSHAVMNTTHKKMYVYNSASGSYTTGNYFAVTVRSPGTGNYQMTLNYGQTKHGSTNGGVYLFDASVDPAAWATAEPLFSDFVSYSRNAANANDVTTTFDATIPMEAGKEYTLVFTNEGAANSEYDGSFNAMYLDSVVLNNASPYTVDGVYYNDFNEANWAALDGNMTVNLNTDAVLGEVRTAGSAIDLNGHTLTVDALSGSVIDSSEGNTGLLSTANGNVIFSEDNADIPLYDTTAGGYRLFDYTLELHETVEPVGTASQKFWFKFHFRASDAEGAELDADAYALVVAGGSDFQISTELTWNGAALDPVYFGRNYEGLETATAKIDAFSKEWADGATSNRWLFVTVSGLGSDMTGTLTVKPVFTANGVNISSGTLSYTSAAAEA